MWNHGWWIVEFCRNGIRIMNAAGVVRRHDAPRQIVIPKESSSVFQNTEDFDHLFYVQAITLFYKAS